MKKIIRSCFSVCYVFISCRLRRHGIFRQCCFAGIV